MDNITRRIPTKPTLRKRGQLFGGVPPPQDILGDPDLRVTFHLSFERS